MNPRVVLPTVSRQTPGASMPTKLFLALVVMFVLALAPAQAAFAATDPDFGGSATGAPTAEQNAGAFGGGTTDPDFGGSATGAGTAPTGTGTGTGAEAPAGSGTEAPTGSDAGTGATSSADGVSAAVQEGIANESVNGAVTIMGRAAQGALTYVMSFMDVSTTPLVYSTCSVGQLGCWFQEQYRLLSSIAIWIMLPMAVISVIHSVLKGSFFNIVKTFAIFLPIAVLGTAVATQFVQLLLIITDDMSRVFQTASAENVGVAVDRIGALLSDPFNNSALVAADGQGAETVGNNLSNFSRGIVVAILCIPLLISCIVVGVVMTFRASSIYLATAFLPIGFALMVWPAAAKYFRKLALFLIAMIFSKVVMVAGLSLAMSVMVDATAEVNAPQTLNGEAIATVAGTTGAAATNGDAFGALIVFIAMLLVIGFAPLTIMNFLDNFSLPEASQAVASFNRRQGFVSMYLGVTRFRAIATQADESRKVAAYDIPNVRTWAENTSVEEMRLNYMGIYRSDTGNFEITDGQLQAAGFDINDQDAVRIRQMSMSSDANLVALAHMALSMGNNEFAGFAADPGSGQEGDPRTFGVNRFYDASQKDRVQTVIFDDIATRDGDYITRNDPRLMLRNAENWRQTNTNSQFRSEEIIYMTGLSGRNPFERQALQSLRHHARSSTVPLRVSGGERVTVGAQIRNNLQHVELDRARLNRGERYTYVDEE